MAIFYDTNSLPQFNKPSITIGTFDGVHLGHKTILKELSRHAREAGGESVVITFEPHPRKLLFPQQSLKLITPLQDKLQLISDAGIQHIVVVPFTRDFADMPARDYVEHFLVAKFQPGRIVIGYDHHFGHDRTGNIQLLRQLQQEFGYQVFEIPAQLIDEAAVSSTKIRNALTEGMVADAAQMLGRNYCLKGTVIKGKSLGRTIGYPTANIQPSDADQLVPSNGIYAVQVKWKERSMGGMLSIGFNPTVTDEGVRHIEVNIFDFDEDLYGELLEISFVQWLRSEEKFPSLEALKAQLAEDERRSREILGC